MILDKYYKYLSSRVIGFSKVTSIQILTHLITKYAELEDNDIQEIYRKMEETISGETIFEEFIEKIEWNQEAFVVKNPYTPAQIFSMAYANIKNAGYIKMIVGNGPENHGSKKTWSNFNAHLARAIKETQRSSRTSKTKGYAENFQSAQANTELFTEMQQYYTLAMVNLAMATQADRTSVVLLTKTISDLSTQVATITAKLATAHSENARPEKLGHRSSPAKHGRRASSNQTPYNQNLLQDRNVYSRSGHKFEPNGYFSYHGFKVEESHTSVTCHYPGNCRNKLYTRLDTKGGETWNKEWINGKPAE